MGHTAHGEHDRRHDRADEFMEVAMSHWDTCEDRAIVADRATGPFAHPEKVHRLDHKGEFSSRAARSPSRGSDRAIRC